MVISVDNIHFKILYFMEDKAHESFIIPLVDRIAIEESVCIVNDVRSARGGYKFISELHRFLNDVIKFGFTGDVILVAVDSDRYSYQQRKSQIVKLFKNKEHLLGKLVLCIPDPHIERWYIEDFQALKTVLGIPVPIDKPPYKNDKNYYKQLVNRIFDSLDVYFSGYEYGEEIAGEIDQYILEKANANFGKFITDLRNMFKRLKE